jgi:hypothetical protein
MVKQSSQCLYYYRCWYIRTLPATYRHLAEGHLLHGQVDVVDVLDGLNTQLGIAEVVEVHHQGLVLRAPHDALGANLVVALLDVSEMECSPSLVQQMQNKD